MATCFVFDLDGTLIDSRKAVRVAYERAGVIMPEMAWGKPWDEWLTEYCDGNYEEALRRHRIKNEHFLSCLEMYAVETPVAHICRTLITAGDPVYVITGGSLEAATIALEHIKVDVTVLYDYELSVDGKTKILMQLWDSHFTHGIYFDDLDGVRIPPGWTGVRVK